MSKKPKITRSILSLLIGSICAPYVVMAAPMPFAQYPAGSASRQPAPNVIVSVDNSGSMGVAGINNLKNALKETFKPENVPDDSIRLAYQSMWNCNNIPSTHADCGGYNYMQSLKGLNDKTDPSPRGRFLKWVDTLVAGNNTPSHAMMWNAGEYLKTIGISSPWNAVPGTTQNPIVTCRRAYHILMTDGGWNNNPTNMIGNADGGLSFNLPDGEFYSITSPQTTIYRDTWGYGAMWGPALKNKPIPTLSDMAFYYWATDLQPSILNQVIPLIKKSGDETFANAGTSQTISQYWNPKNDPANWQHMTTNTIGYNNAAAWLPNPNPNGTNPIFNIAAGMYGGDFANAILGIKRWQDPIIGNETQRQEELWHMAINSRGKFYPAKTSADLVAAFKEIIGGIVADNSAPITSFTSASSSLARSGTDQYASGYEAKGWVGFIKSDSLAKVTGVATANLLWGTKAGFSPPKDHLTTADKLDALPETGATSINTRLVLSYRDKVTGGGGTSFEWANDEANLSTAQKELLKAGGTDTMGDNRLNFLRGNRTLEGNTTTNPFRIRASRQGDIANSAIWYTAQPVSSYGFDKYLAFSKKNKDRLPMLYVGGNDGMLHGFSAKDGSEKIAYIPKGVITNLPELAKPDYQHLYFVDGSPFTADVNWGDSTTPDWRTLLVGTLGAGGKGYFVLDVTAPGSTATDGTGVASNFDKSNAATLVVMDKTYNKDELFSSSSDEADIGYIMAGPVIDDANLQKVTQVTQMNSKDINGKNRWAVILGNGYNSTNERPVLLIQYLDGNKELVKIPAVAATGTGKALQNGLSAPRLLDINGDGKTDFVYAGDLQGNMWKFDISSSDITQWKVSFGGAPLYTAVYSSGGSSSAQPITAAPAVKANDRGIGGLMVAFGTGRNITEGDRTDTTSKQTIYSVLDNTHYKLSSDKKTVEIDTSLVTPAIAGTGLTGLVQQTMVSTTAIDGSGISTGRQFWKMSQNNVDYQGTGPSHSGAKKGWYFNLPESGERLLDPVTFFDGSNNLEIITRVPGSGGSVAEESCAPTPQEEKKYRTLLNIMDGKKPGVQILDANGDGIYGAADQGVSRMTATRGSELKIDGIKTTIRTPGGAGGPVAAAGSGVDPLAKMPETPLRPSWRQLQ